MKEMFNSITDVFQYYLPETMLRTQNYYITTLESMINTMEDFFSLTDYVRLLPVTHFLDRVITPLLQSGHITLRVDRTVTTPSVVHEILEPTSDELTPEQLTLLGSVYLHVEVDEFAAFTEFCMTQYTKELSYETIH